MTSNESDRSIDDPGRPADPTSLPLVAETAPIRRPSTPIAWALALSAAAIAGIVAWGLVESVYDRLQPGLLNTPGIPSPEEANAAAVARVSARVGEAALAFGSMGAALGIALGLVGGMVSRSSRRGWIAAVVGAVAGATSGALASWLLTPLFYRWYNPDSDPIILAIVIQGGICAAIGAASGAAFGTGSGGKSGIVRGAASGTLGAILGVVVFQILAALAFPADGTNRPVSATWTARLFADLAVTGFTAIGVLLGARPRPDPPGER